MKFNSSLKHIKVGETVGRLERTERFYPCHCGTVSGWRVYLDNDCPPAVVCSDECLDILDGANPDASPGLTPPEAGSNTFDNGVEENAKVVNLGSGVLLEIKERTT